MSACDKCGAEKQQAKAGWWFCKPCKAAAQSAALTGRMSVRVTERRRRERVARAVIITRLGCWEFADGSTSTRFRLRLAWMRQHGPKPPGLEFRHRCDVRGCFNPAHVIPGTSAQNKQDIRAARLGRPDLRATPLPDDWGEVEVAIWRRRVMREEAA